jgi:hypothetical protein
MRLLLCTLGLLAFAGSARADFFDDVRRTFQKDIPRTFEQDIPRAFGATPKKTDDDLNKPGKPPPARQDRRRP